MTSLALPAGDLFSVVTTAGRDARAATWKSLLNWPRFGDDHVDYDAETPAQRNLWAVRMDEAVKRAEKPVLLVASGESCNATAWWARLSPTPYVSRVAGALLFAPQGRQDEGDKFAAPRIVLPFPSVIIRADAGALDERVLALAEGWGSRFVEEGWDGEASAWQQAQNLILRLTARVVERDMRIANCFSVD
ncbi:alpha/beta hydrolase [Sphingomonas sp. AOB5]|uniref:alpha/beta hydrolase n=1 Tax=Sphingomonas sp. AOB5 TaxID=3034017 RepID=UPI0023F8F5D1|nr:alpha/beta hydrolase [Sphingomonas sp. AOB5]MDF7775495.1 alpha/beta hydrolase [Sphingomonas sp. AOB5]